MTLDPPLADLVARVSPIDEDAADEARRELDRKTKPRGSLGTLEDLAVRVAAIRGTAAPGPLHAVVVVAAADHGLASEGVSAYPQEVTRQMLANFAGGGAAVSVLCRSAGARLVVVDAGVVEPVGAREVRELRLGPGTANALRGPAMTRAQALEAVGHGADLADELAADGAAVIALGEMGIGNTTAASAIACALLGVAPEQTCGPGTGLDEAGLARKRDVVSRMLETNRPDADDPLRVLAAVGGFEIGVLAGLAIGAAARRSVVVLDGFISAIAALIAVRLAPDVRGYLVASHLSPEPGHALILRDLELRPLLDLGLRLGEGSGAALALPLIRAARSILVEMATFSDAGVTDTGR